VARMAESQPVRASFIVFRLVGVLGLFAGNNEGGQDARRPKRNPNQR
jgi:hypothetical protein